MGEFSRRLARGQTLSRALTGARAVRIEAGAPAAAWAGLVVLGDGDVVPITAESGQFSGLILWGLAALGAVLGYSRIDDPKKRQRFRWNIGADSSTR